MDGHAVLVTHFVKFVNADHTPVSQYHGTGLQPLFTCQPPGTATGSECQSQCLKYAGILLPISIPVPYTR